MSVYLAPDSQDMFKCSQKENPPVIELKLDRFVIYEDPHTWSICGHTFYLASDESHNFLYIVLDIDVLRLCIHCRTHKCGQIWSHNA